MTDQILPCPHCGKELMVIPHQVAPGGRQSVRLGVHLETLLRQLVDPLGQLVRFPGQLCPVAHQLHGAVSHLITPSHHFSRPQVRIEKMTVRFCSLANITFQKRTESGQ